MRRRPIVLAERDQWLAEQAKIAARHRLAYVAKKEPWTCNCEDCLLLRRLPIRRGNRLLQWGESQMSDALKAVADEVP
jgi:hypothetical protein